MRFALEAAQRRLIAAADPLGRHQLDRRVAREQPMAPQPHFAHAAFAERLDELVAAEGAGLADLTTEAIEQASGATASSAHT